MCHDLEIQLEKELKGWNFVSEKTLHHLEGIFNHCMSTDGVACSVRYCRYQQEREQTHPGKTKKRMMRNNEFAVSPNAQATTQLLDGSWEPSQPCRPLQSAEPF